MTQEQIDFFATIDPATMDAVKQLLAKREKELYNERWWSHGKTDNYIYIVNYANGDYHMDYLGERSYQRYLKDDDAVSIGRRTKDLFPIYEELMRKERA